MRGPSSSPNERRSSRQLETRRPVGRSGKFRHGGADSQGLDRPGAIHGEHAEEAGRKEQRTSDGESMGKNGKRDERGDEGEGGNRFHGDQIVDALKTLRPRESYKKSAAPNR